jgi:enoyl-CoA hydratase/carnithine racemase
MSDLIIEDRIGGVAVITLNRPERMNAVNTPMGEAFDAAMVRAALDPAVRVVVVTGAGDRGFCAGADMDRLDGLAPGGSEKRIGAVPGSPHPVLDALVEAPPRLRTRYSLPLALPQPVIAAVNGAAAGVGLALAANCDVRFASRTAIFTAGFPLRGLTAEAGLARMLTVLVGRGAASDLLLSGRKIDAEEALRIGLVNAVTTPEDLLPHAMAYAARIADEASPRSTRVIKRQLRMAIDESFEDALVRSHGETASSLLSEDFREGVASFKERRKARFTGR